MFLKPKKKSCFSLFCNLHIAKSNKLTIFASKLVVSWSRFTELINTF